MTGQVLYSEMTLAELDEAINNLWKRNAGVLNSAHGDFALWRIYSQARQNLINKSEAPPHG